MFSPNILIADDDPTIRILLGSVAKIIGCTIIGEAENGQIAIQKYKQLRPHIVLVDINMPVLDGVTALKEIKKINSRACIIMLTAENTTGSVKESILAGAKAYILKGSSPENIADDIKVAWIKHINQLTRAH